MEPRGLDFLRPIWWPMQTQKLNVFGQSTQNDDYIGLAPDEVRVYYTTHVNDFKPKLKPGQSSIRDAVFNQLKPG